MTPLYNLEIPPSLHMKSLQTHHWDIKVLKCLLWVTGTVASQDMKYMRA